MCPASPGGSSCAHRPTARRTRRGRRSSRGRLRRKGVELRRSPEGRLTKSRRFVLSELPHRLDEVGAAILRVDERIEVEARECRDPFVAEAVRLLQTIPGVGPRAAAAIVSEVGVDMSRFPSDSHLASRAGRCPGNHESAGKRSEEHTSELQSHSDLVCRLLLETKKEDAGAMDEAGKLTQKEADEEQRDAN